MNKNKCTECEKEIFTDVEFISCKQCKFRAHIDCAKIASNTSSSTRSTKKLSRVSWICSRCTASGATGGDTSEGGSDQGEDDGLYIKTMLKQLNEKYEAILNILSDVPLIKTTLETLSTQIEEIKQDQTKQNKAIGELTTKVNQLNLDLDDKDKEILALNNRINALEQTYYVNNLEICGIPKLEGENVNTLSDIVKKVANVMGVTTKGIIEARRGFAPRRENAAPPPIALRFNTSTARDEWMAKRKNRDLTVGKVLDSQSNVPIYVNEQLSPFNKKLFWYAKQSAKDRNYKYVWSKYGKIYARKNDSMGVIKINSLDDITYKMV